MSTNLPSITFFVGGSRFVVRCGLIDDRLAEDDFSAFVAHHRSPLLLIRRATLALYVLAKSSLTALGSAPGWTTKSNSSCR